MKNKMNKIYILGPSGAGTTYLSKKISKILKIKAYDSDDVRFIKKFTKARTPEQRKKLINKIIKDKKWIIDARGTEWDRQAMLKADIVLWVKTNPVKRTYRILKRYNQRRNDEKFEEKFTDLYPLIKYTLSYEKGKHPTSFKSVSEFLNKNKIKPVILKTNKQIKEFLQKL